MLKTVLWIAAACAAVLVALAVSRSLHFDSAPAPKAPMVVTTAAPPAPPKAAVVPPPPPPPPPPEVKPPPTPSDLQVQEDAAATGMTTATEPEAPKDKPPT
jgi:hypothetical protein